MGAPVDILAGIKVLDLSEMIAAPYATKFMADYGAEVIKVEKPLEGDPSRHYGPFKDDDPHPEKSGLFLHLNSNKKSLTLNLKSAEGREILLKLAKEADLLVESFRPGTMESFGLGYEAMKQVNPRLVMVSVSNFGQTGPYRDFEATEIVMYAMGGGMYSCGIPGREPVKLFADVGQFHAGLVIFGHTMGGIFAQAFQGIGQYIDISLLEIWASNQDRVKTLATAFQYCGEIQPKQDLGGVGYPPSGYYPTKDGYISGISINRNHLEACLNFFDRPGLAQGWIREPKWADPTKYGDEEMRAQLEAVIYPWLAERTMVEAWMESQDFRVPSSPLFTVADLLKDEHFVSRGAFTELEHPVAGKIVQPSPPYKYNKDLYKIKNPAPLLGQHNAEVLGKLGYGKPDLVRLRQQGVI